MDAVPLTTARLLVDRVTIRRDNEITIDCVIPDVSGALEGNAPIAVL
jgi:hypothetical protein